jgi:cellulose synthase/poly-beta-1,6-N-acetylglucosamine synthase-like glycosyltransferase
MQVTFFSESIVMNIGVIVSFTLFLFLLFLLATQAAYFLRKEKPYNQDYWPETSIIIPAYNEESNIEGCLKSVVESSYPARLMEIIVVDDESTDHTSALVSNFIKYNKSHNIRLLKATHVGKSKALNLAIRQCRHELVVTVDADALLGNDTIRKILLPMQDLKVSATNAVTLIREPNSLIEVFQKVEYAINSVIRVSFSRVYKNSIWFMGIVACYRKSVLKKTGYLKADTLTEDLDVCLELYQQGYDIVTVHDAIIRTHACKSVNELIRQRMRWYYGALQALFKNRKALSSKRKSPAVLFLFINQAWWTLFAFIFFPLTAYQVYYWFPQGALIEAGAYLLRWFSLAGPFYVLYKVPEWGISFLSIFGVMAGLLTLTSTLIAMGIFKEKYSVKEVVCIIFYFPYTILINFSLVLGVIYNLLFARKKYFIK